MNMDSANTKLITSRGIIGGGIAHVSTPVRSTEHMFNRLSVRISHI